MEYSDTDLVLLSAPVLTISDVLALAPVAAPEPVVEASAPAPVVEASAPAPVVEVLAPSPVADAPAPSPVVDAPVPSPVVEAPAPAPVVEAPVPSPVVEVLAPSPVADAPVPSPVADAPVPAPVPTSMIPIVYPPSDVTANAHNSFILLKWSPSISSDTTSYVVKQEPGTKTYSTTNTYLSLSNLIAGVSYTFSVSAKTALSESADVVSLPVVFCTQPSPPTIKSVTLEDTTVRVSWDPPVEINGSKLTQYVVSSCPDDISITTEDTSALFTSLEGGKSYSFTVTASNEGATSEPSASSDTILVCSVPSAPVNIIAYPMGNSIILSWKTPKNTGGSDITGYVVTSQPDNIKKTVTGSLSTSITNLTPGTSYTFTVTANNKYGESVSSSASGAVIYNTPPTAPTAVSASVNGETITVKWKAPSSSGGVPIKSYRVISTPDDVVKRVVSGLSTTFPSLTPGVSYTFKVTATNTNGTSPPSDSSKPVMIELPLTMPQNVVATKSGEKAITVTWDPYPAAFNVKYYKVTMSPEKKTLLKLNATYLVFENLEFNKAYTFTVVAVTNTAISPTSLISNEVVLTEPVAAPEPAPEPVAAPEPAPEPVAAPAPAPAPVAAPEPAPAPVAAPEPEPVAAPAPEPVAAPAPEPVAAPAPEPAPVAAPVPEPVVEDPMAAISARLEELNRLIRQKEQVESKSLLSFVDKSAFLPSVPQNVTISIKDRNYVLSWQPPVNTGGDNKLKYKIRSITENDTAVTSATIIQISGISENKQYKYAVCAVNNAGDGPFVEITAPILPIQDIRSRRVIGQRKIRCV